MKYTVKSIAVAALFVGLIAAGTFFLGGPFGSGAGLVTPVRAQEAAMAAPARQFFRPCNIGAVIGKYGISIQGTVLPPLAPVPTPGVAVGTFEVDAAGNLTGADTMSFGGQIIPRTYSGTVNVKSDCTFTSRWTILTGLPGLIINTSGVIVDGGNEIYFVETDPNTIFTAVAKRL